MAIWELQMCPASTPNCLTIINAAFSIMCLLLRYEVQLFHMASAEQLRFFTHVLNHPLVDEFVAVPFDVCEIILNLLDQKQVRTLLSSLPCPFSLSRSYSSLTHSFVRSFIRVP